MTGKWPTALDSGWIEPLNWSGAVEEKPTPATPCFLKGKALLPQFTNKFELCVFFKQGRGGMWPELWLVMSVGKHLQEASCSKEGSARSSSSTRQNSAALWSQNVCAGLSAQQQGFGSQQRILHVMNALGSLLTKGTREASCSLCQGVWVRFCGQSGLLSNVR